MTSQEVSLAKRFKELKGDMLDRLEGLSNMIESQQGKLQPIGDKVIEKVESALKNESISAYKAAVAYGKCVDSLVKMGQLQLGLYDRLSGTIMGGLVVEEEEADEFDENEMEIRREAEKLCYQLVKEEVMRKKAEEQGEGK